MDWSALRGSPPEAMAETLDWIRAEYGAIDYFLASVGCDEDWRLSSPAELQVRIE